MVHYLYLSLTPAVKRFIGNSVHSLFITCCHLFWSFKSVNCIHPPPYVFCVLGAGWPVQIWLTQNDLQVLLRHRLLVSMPRNKTNEVNKSPISLCCSKIPVCFRRIANVDSPLLPRQQHPDICKPKGLQTGVFISYNVFGSSCWMDSSRSL